MGRVAPSEFSEDESRYHFHNAFFHSTPSVLHMMLIHSLLVNRNDHAWAAGLCVWEAPPASAAKGAAAKRSLGRVLRLRDIWNVQRVQFSLAERPWKFTAKEPAKILRLDVNHLRRLIADARVLESEGDRGSGL